MLHPTAKKYEKFMCNVATLETAFTSEEIKLLFEFAAYASPLSGKTSNVGF